MDPTRFDAIARSAATPATRRAALGALTAGGLLGALGLGRGAPSAAAQGQGQGQDGLCAMAFAATVRQGPSASAALVPGGAPGELRGNLLFSLSESGSLYNANLQLADGSSRPVVGQATGNALHLRIDFGQGRALVAVGVGAQPIARCQGPVDGPATGPEVGDLGEWHGAAGLQNLPGSAGGGRPTSPPPPPPPPPRPAPPPPQAASCPAGQTRCGNGCVDLRTDPRNCGECGNRCPSGEVCVGGTCIPGGIVGGGGADCPEGQTRCGASGCRVLDRDIDHCGACDTPCGDSQECAGGECFCSPGFTRCGDACVDTTSDAANCSACGIACGADERCGDRLCVPVNGGGGCRTGLDRCGTTCADVTTDATNCGRCGVRCATGEACANGECGPAATVCADQGESCATNECCVGYCGGGQDDDPLICTCVPDNELCAATGTGGCCSGEPCNDNGYCGACGGVGAACASDADCCTGEYAGACCSGVCTDVTQNELGPLGYCPCAQIGESCATTDCCFGYCSQDAICECISDGVYCAPYGNNPTACCSGQPCSAEGYCGVCSPLGGTCNGDADCCSGTGAAVLCCFDGTELETLCTDVTGIGFVCPGDPIPPEEPVTCEGGFTDCGGTCVNLLESFGNCGACFRSCGIGGACNGGECGPPQPSCLILGSPCTLGVDICCEHNCQDGTCQCAPAGVIGLPNECCSGISGGDGYCL